MQELSDITSGLSELLQSSTQARAKEQEKEREKGREAAAAFTTNGAATDTPPSETSPLLPADRNLLSSSEGLTFKLKKTLIIEFLFPSSFVQLLWRRVIQTHK